LVERLPVPTQNEALEKSKEQRGRFIHFRDLDLSACGQVSPQERHADLAVELWAYVLGQARRFRESRSRLYPRRDRPRTRDQVFYQGRHEWLFFSRRTYSEAI